MSVHRSYDLRRHQDEQLVLFLSRFFGTEKQGADVGNVAQERQSADFGRCPV